MWVEMWSLEAWKPSRYCKRQRVPDHAVRLEPADRLVGPAGHARSAQVLVGAADALVDLDDRLDLRVVVAPVGPLVGRRGVRGTDAAQLVQVVVEHLGIVVVNARSARRARQPRQGADAAAGEHHVAMAVGIGHAPLVGEHGGERGGNVVELGRLLDQPPGVLLAAAVVVVAVADPVEAGAVDRVAPHVLEGTVAAAVHRDLGVAVELAAEELVGLAAGVDAVIRAPGRCRRPRWGEPAAPSVRSGGRRSVRNGRDDLACADIQGGDLDVGIHEVAAGDGRLSPT